MACWLLGCVDVLAAREHNAYVATTLTTVDSYSMDTVSIKLGTYGAVPYLHGNHGCRQYW